MAGQAGIRANLQCGGPEKKWIPEVNGSGCAALDYDNDGLLDLLIVNGATMDRLREIVQGRVSSSTNSGIFLYRNLGDGRFQDVTVQAGLSNPYWATGANAADFDNDGTHGHSCHSIGVDLLFRNLGNGAFVEVGKTAGFSRRWPGTRAAHLVISMTTAIWTFSSSAMSIFARRAFRKAPVCNYRGLAAFCGPLGLKGERDVLYRNNGNGTFRDVTESAGVSRHRSPLWIYCSVQ